MELKPGYKQTEVGVIPEEWEIVTATDACDLVVDCKNRTPPVVPDSDFAVVRTPNVRNGQFVLDELRFTDEESYRVWTARAVPQLGDIMITREAPLGEVCAVPPNRKVCLGQRMMLYRPCPDRVSSTYILYSLMSEPVRENLFRKIGGSTVGHAKVDDIRFLQLPLPPLPEQRAIAAALSDVDGLLCGLDRLIAKKRDLKQAATQQLLTGQTRLPGFGGEWEVKRLGDCLLSRPDYGINAAAVPFSDRLPSYIRITDISEHGRYCPAPRVSVNAPDTDQYYLHNGDIVFARTGATVGKCYLYDRRDGELVFAGFLIRVRPNPKLLVSAYLAAYSTTTPYWNWVRLMSMRSGQPGVNGAEYAQLPISLPPLPEQTAIAEVLTEMDAELAALAQRREKTRALKQAMMQELLTGRTRLQGSLADVGNGHATAQESHA